MDFSSKYTTTEKILAEKDKPDEEKTEKDKTIITSDTFALGECIELFNKNIQNLIRSLAK